MPHDRTTQNGNHMTDTRQQLINILDWAPLLPALLKGRGTPARGRCAARWRPRSPFA